MQPLKSIFLHPVNLMEYNNSRLNIQSRWKQKGNWPKTLSCSCSPIFSRTLCKSFYNFSDGSFMYIHVFVLDYYFLEVLEVYLTVLFSLEVYLTVLFSLVVYLTVLFPRRFIWRWFFPVSILKHSSHYTSNGYHA